MGQRRWPRWAQNIRSSVPSRGIRGWIELPGLGHLLTGFPDSHISPGPFNFHSLALVIADRVGAVVASAGERIQPFPPALAEGGFRGTTTRARTSTGASPSIRECSEPGRPPARSGRRSSGASPIQPARRPRRRGAPATALQPVAVIPRLPRRPGRERRPAPLPAERPPGENLLLAAKRFVHGEEAGATC